MAAEDPFRSFTLLFFILYMVGTRARNKDAHPAAPVMSEAVKVKPGIKQTKRRTKKPTKAEEIRQLRAQLAALENPDHTSPVSKEPLFTKGSSPPRDDIDDDLPPIEPETATDIGSDDFVVVGGKRVALSSQDTRSLKRTKTDDSFDDVRPTVRNKPSGLVNNWPRVVSDSGSAVGRRPSALTLSTVPYPTAGLSATPLRPALRWQSRSATPTIDSFDLSSSTPDTTAPYINQLPPPFTNSQHDHQLRDNGLQQLLLAQAYSSAAVHSLPRKFREGGKIHSPGLKDLPHGLQIGFRNTFIRRIIKIMFCDTSPWNNPNLPLLQREFDLAYPLPRYQLHTDDAAVIPTNRDIGALRSRIGEEALDAVIEFLPAQYDKRALNSKSARSGYITKLLESKQHPFIWEYFRPGTIQIPRGEETYYDEIRRGAFQSIPVLRAFSIYFTSYGIQGQVPSEDPGKENRPIGALALAAAAVERGYFLHCSGDYVSNGNEFSATNWIRSTNTFINRIKGLTGENWTAIFHALQRLREANAQKAKIEAGVVEPEDQEPLLPDDPPSRPSE